MLLSLNLSVQSKLDHLEKSTEWEIRNNNFQ